MNIRSRLARLERSAPGGRGRCITLTKYEGETAADVWAAYPEIERQPNDLVVIIRPFRVLKPGEARRPACVVPIKNHS